jgi:hypothetical protein
MELENGILIEEQTACVFYDAARNRCKAKEVIAEFALPGAGHRIARLRKGYKDKCCKTKKHRFCYRKFLLEQIIKYGDYEG